MADDPMKRLAAQGRREVPPTDASFADRLESHLRVEHAAHAKPSRNRLPWMLPRIGVAAVVAVAVVVGAVALSGRDAGVPVAVVDEQTPVADQPVAPAIGGDERAAPAAISPTPTPSVAVADASTLPAATTEAASDVPPVPTATPATPTPEVATVEPAGEGERPPATAATPTAAATAGPTATQVPTREAQPVPSSTATVRPTTPPSTPRPTPTPLPPATPVPAPTVTPTPVEAPEPASIELECRVRVAADGTGVICDWETAVTDRIVVHYQVWRSSNGGEVAVVARPRASAVLRYIDRDVNPGDTLTYLVRGLTADGTTIAASVREVIVVPAEG